MNYCRTIKLLSSYTIQAYFSDLSQFAKFVGAKFPFKIERVDVRAFVIFLKTKKMMVSTINRKIASLKTFFGWLHREKLIFKNLVYGFKLRKEIKLPRYLNQHEIYQLMEKPNIDTIAGKRDLAILEMIYTAGLRLSELNGLRVCDIDFNQSFMIVKGKGSKERILPIGSCALMALKKYLNAAPTKYHDYIFRNLLKQRITNRSIERIIKGYMAKIGRGELSAHSLRHSFATHMLENGCNVRDIQEFLGHATISTTQNYLHCNSSLLKKNYVGLEETRRQMDQMKLFEYNSMWEVG